MHSAFIIPNKDAMVRDPITRALLPVAGKAVTLLGGEGRYWRRRINSGSVIVIGPPGTKKIRRKSNKESNKEN